MTKSTAFSILAFASLIQSFTTTAQAGTFVPATNREWNTHNFLNVVQFFDENERLAHVSHANNLFHYIVDDAVAAPMTEGSDCLVAGYVGTVKNGSCTHDDLFNSTGQIVCNKEMFGDLVIDKPKDGFRWTYGCATAFLKKAGVDPANIDKALTSSKISGDDSVKLSAYIDKNTPHLDTINAQLQTVCDKSKASGNSKDIKDCALISSFFKTAVKSQKIAAKRPCHTGQEMGETSGFSFNQDITIDKKETSISVEQKKTEKTSDTETLRNHCDIQKPAALKGKLVKFEGGTRGTIASSPENAKDWNNSSTVMTFDYVAYPYIDGVKSEKPVTVHVQCSEGLDFHDISRASIEDTLVKHFKFDPACPASRTTASQSEPAANTRSAK